MTVAAVYGRILEQARTEPLMRRALDLASTDHALTLAWCQRAPLGKDAGIPMGPAIAGEWV